MVYRSYAAAAGSMQAALSDIRFKADYLNRGAENMTKDNYADLLKEWLQEMADLAGQYKQIEIDPTLKDDREF